MTVADALPRLLDVCLNGATHPDYALTVARATLYRQLATGDIAPLMRRMARRESEADYSARLQLTIETVSSSWAQLRTPFYTVARLRGGSVTRRFDYDEAIAATEATRRAQRLESVLSQYYQRQPLENYLAERLSKSHCMSDPNAWLVTEFAPFDFRTQVAQPYPVLVPCEAAVDFSRAAGVTQQLTVRLAVPGYPSATRYTCYLDSQAIDCWPVVYEGQTVTPTIPGGPVAGQEFADVNGKVLYHYRILANKPGRVPAQVLGYVVDEEGSGESYVSPLHSAVPFLLQMLKVGSENDIVMSQMAFPVRVAYVAKCPGAGRDSLGNIHSCIGGADSKMPDGKCSVCGGTGNVPVPTSAQETVALPMPEPGEELKLKAADMLNFVSPPTDNPKLQLEYLESRRNLAQQAVFGSSDADRVAGSKTATQRQIELQEKLTALAPFADWYSSAYVYHATVSAAYVDVAQGLTVVYEYAPDLEQTTEADLYAKRQAAVVAGADAQTLEAIDKEIAYKQFANDEAGLVRRKVRERFVTFQGYSEAQVFQMASMGYISAEERVARTHADIIFADIEAARPDFYQLAYQAQADLVAAKIAVILAKLPAPVTSTSSAFKALSFTAPAATSAAPAVPVTT